MINQSPTLLWLSAVLSVDHSVVDLETIEALYENVRIILLYGLYIYVWTAWWNVFIFLSNCQRAQPHELEKIKQHYEMSKEEDVKLLDKPEQSVFQQRRQMSDLCDVQSSLFVQWCWCPRSPGSCMNCSGFQTSRAELTAWSFSRFSTTRSRLSIESSTLSPPSVRWGEKTNKHLRSKPSWDLIYCLSLSWSQDLLESSQVREVMGLVLALGNHMNGGNRTRGQADGFGLDILPKLKDVKSRVRTII